MTKLSNDDQVTIEQLIDQSDLSTVLDAIAEICRLKAFHVRQTWQDKALSNAWVKAAQAVERAASHKSVCAL